MGEELTGILESIAQTIVPISRETFTRVFEFLDIVEHVDLGATTMGDVHTSLGINENILSVIQSVEQVFRLRNPEWNHLRNENLIARELMKGWWATASKFGLWFTIISGASWPATKTLQFAWRTWQRFRAEEE